MAKVVQKSDIGPINSMKDGDVAELLTGININNDMVLERGTVIQRYGSNIIVIGKAFKEVPDLIGESIYDSAWSKVIIRLLPKGTLIQL